MREGRVNKVFVNRTFNCSVERLFDWLVKPELLVKWFGPRHLSVGRVESDLRVGGQFSIELLRPEKESFFLEGEYLEIAVPSHLSYSYQYRGLANSFPDSTVRIELTPVSESQSELSFVQDFVSPPPQMETRAAAWEYMFGVLAGFVEVGKG